jgi:hypothetical protein
MILVNSLTGNESGRRLCDFEFWIVKPLLSNDLLNFNFEES